MPSPGATEPRTPRDGGAPKSASAGRIQHVVIIDMENRSFDNVLGKFCMLVKDSQIAHDPCDGTDHGLLPEGQLIRLSQARDLMPDLNHSVPAQRIAIDGGRMDGFSLLHGCTADTDPPYSC